MTATAGPALYSRTLFPELEKLHTTGIYPAQSIEEFVAKRYISADPPITDDQIQPASIDLRLGPVAYRVRASFLPGRNSTVLRKAEPYTTHQLDLSRPTVMERGCVYIVPLLEKWNLPPYVSGKANPKSSIGRIDVFTRLITDYGTEFERVPAGYTGTLYAEIVPRTFSILVEEGTRMNQVRFVRGNPRPADSDITEMHEDQPLFYEEDEALAELPVFQGVWIRVDLEGIQGSDVVGYKAKAHAPLIDVNKVDFYDPSEFWEAIYKPKSRQLILNPSDFYILASRERISVPPQAAAELRGYDSSVGEVRIHYAGFFDPGFGYGQNGLKGAHAVLEVRSHEVPLLLEDGQRVGRVVFERLMTEPHRVYGPAIGSHYQQQGLSLSKHFKRYGPYG